MFYCFLIITYIHCLTKPTFSPTCIYKNYKRWAALVVKLKASQVGVSMSKMTTDMSRLSQRQPCPILSGSWLITEFVTRLRITELNRDCLPFKASKFTRGFLWGWCCPIFSFLCNVLQIVVCPFVLILLPIVLF